MTLYTKLQSLLLEAGLSETENLVYIELLKRPAESAFDLVQRTRLPKTTVYRSLDHLINLKMVEKTDGTLKALSPKNLVAELQKSRRRLGKIASQLKQIAPYLKTKNAENEFEVFETYYTPEQVKEAYIFMAETPYETNLDFGDFESFIPLIGGIETGDIFRAHRAAHAKNNSICTTFGEYSAHYSTRESAKHFGNRVRYLNSDIKNNFIIFSDTSDYVLFTNITEIDDTKSVQATLVKSKQVANAQRQMFDAFSHRLGN